jgi:glycerophosphoryl diester phosphodiesterase
LYLTPIFSNAESTAVDPRYNIINKGSLSNIFHKKTASWLDIQQSLLDRNLFLNNNKVVSVLDPDLCQITAIAHRGDYRKPENTKFAIQYGLSNGFDHIEVDLRSSWKSYYSDDAALMTLLSHDLMPFLKFRAFKVTLPRNSRRKNVLLRFPANNLPNVFTLLYEQDNIQYSYLVTDKIGNATNAKIPSLPTALDSFARLSNGRQKLNVEIKGSFGAVEENGRFGAYRESGTFYAKPHIEALMLVDEQLLKKLGVDSYYYSSGDLEVLKRIRKFNKHVFLALINKASKESLLDKKKTIDDMYSREQAHPFAYNYENRARRMADRLKLDGFYYGKKDNTLYLKNYATKSGIKEISDALGTNSGINLDIRDYHNNHSILKYAHEKGMKLMVYTVNSNQYMLFRLGDARRANSLPDGAIVDFSPVTLCAVSNGGIKAKGDYKAKTPLGKLIQNLPDDADFEKFYEQVDLTDMGIYRTYWGSIKHFPKQNADTEDKVVYQHIGALLEDTGSSKFKIKVIEIDLRN